MNDSITSQTDKFKASLLHRLEELEALQDNSSETRKTVQLDQSSIGRLTRMDAIQGQQMAAETGRRRKTEILRIKSALQRIENGDYGHCVRCDELITLKRLENEPAATLCIDCARESENA